MTTPIIIGPGVLVGVTSLVIHATVEKLSTDTAPGYWVVVDQAAPNQRHVIHEGFLVHPDDVTTEDERIARRQEQIQRKVDLAASWNVDLLARGFTTVEAEMRMVAEDIFTGRDRPQVSIRAPTGETGWRDFIQRLKAIT